MLDELERAYTDLDRMLGLRPQRKIDVVVYDPGLFDQSYRGLFKFQAAGFYHGVIRVRGDTRLTANLSRVLHHELVHAALDAAAPSLIFPGWVNEGLAEWFEARALGKRGLSGGERAALARLAQQGALPPLHQLNLASFARLDADTAAVAYLQSYGVIDHLARHHGERKLAEFVEAIVRHRNLDRALSRVYRLDLATLDARFQAEWRG